jgi:hypothetical protein
MRSLTTVQSKILIELKRRGGTVESLSAFCREIHCDYSHAYNCVKLLEQDGLVDIQHTGKRNSLTIKARQPMFLFNRSDGRSNG